MPKDIVDTTRPTSSGEMLWCVEYASSWYDDDERGSGDRPVGATAYVLAKGQAEAIAKARAMPAFKKAKREKDRGAEEKITATIATIESLVAAVDSGEASFYGGSLRQVELHPEDRFRLGVCLIPLDEVPPGFTPA